MTHVTSVTYTRRFVTGQYEHEEISVTYSCDEYEKDQARDIILLAREDVLKSSTGYLKALKEKQEKENKNESATTK